MKTALDSWARQSGRQVIYKADDVAASRSNGVRGSHSAEAALASILAGTGFASRTDSSGAVAIVKTQPSATSAVDESQGVGIAQADADSNGGDVIVTGSRTIVNGNNSPTPVTTISVDRLAQTTPSNVPDALNKLPQFAGSRSVTSLDNPSRNATGNILNLRSFGAIRTLILLDGHRVPATAADGTVDTNTLPQMLMQRVDVVTGGASAVYGSDAVTGVVNFVLEKKFNGLRMEAQGGISGRGDAPSWKAGIAGGTSLLDGRLHLEGSFEHFHSDGLMKTDRASTSSLTCFTGAGTAANPFVTTPNCHQNVASFGGLVTSGAMKGYDFASNGVLSPFVHGQATATGSIEVGGNGDYASGTSASAYLTTDQTFARADYDFGSGIAGYAQAGYARTQNGNYFFPTFFTGTTFSSTNAFLSPATQAQLSQNGATTFTLSKYFNDNQDLFNLGVTQSVNATAGLSGRITDKIKWDVFYTHGWSQLHETGIRNYSNGRLAAALDAVINPANGQIVCRVTITNPGLYPGCVPLNVFGPTADLNQGLGYIQTDTSFRLTNTLDDVGGSISGQAFDLWAGPVRFALSGEFRRIGLTNVSTASPTAKLDCTGLRYNCTSGMTAVYVFNTTADVDASEKISEGAFEANVPLLKNVPLAQSLEVNGAVRYAHYSVSGNATTWKIGVDWHVNDELRFRGTRSRDIRAPTLSDLYAPLTQSVVGYNDIHTGVNSTTQQLSQGNPDLTFEVAKTWTVGGVYKPAWFPRFSVSVDYYDLDMKNGISTISGANQTVQAACEASGGTSPLCALYVRPLAFSDKSAANYPAYVLTQALNLARTAMHGIDAEFNYGFNMAGISPNLPGSVDLRLLLTYQPVLSTVTIPGQPVVNAAGAYGLAKERVTFFVNYALADVSFASQTRWRSSEVSSNDPTVFYAGGKTPASLIEDINLTYRAKIGSAPVSFFVSVQNLFDKEPGVVGVGAVPGFANPVVAGDDIIGRYFTAGLKLRL